MTTSPHAQRGAVLIVSMIMIFMLSIMGVSAMRNSTLEKRMATNAIQSSTTLQAAESLTERLFNSTAILDQAARQTGTLIEVDAETLRDDIAMQQSAQIVQLGREGVAFGYSDQFVTLRYVAQGDVRIDSARSRAIVRQGATQLVPAGAFK